MPGPVVKPVFHRRPQYSPILRHWCFALMESLITPPSLTFRPRLGDERQEKDDDNKKETPATIFRRLRILPRLRPIIPWKALGEIDLGRADVLLQAVELRRAGDGDDPRLPGELAAYVRGSR